MSYVNAFMMLSFTIHQVRQYFSPRAPPPETSSIPPPAAENLAVIMTCYDETEQEIRNSLDSLAAQMGLEKNKKVIIVICDGNTKKAEGMSKTTADILEQDVFVDHTRKRTFKNAYIGWKRRYVDVDIFTGTYESLPYCCIIKHENQAKRDSLLMVRSFLWKQKLQQTRVIRPDSIFSPQVFDALSTWLVQDAEIKSVDHMVGIDADTVFHPRCIQYLLEEARRPGTIAVVGDIEVSFNNSKFPTFWSLYQNGNYFMSQRARRMYESHFTERAICLSGCCHLMKVCEVNCGDSVLAGPFGYYPGPDDNLWSHLLAKIGEDRHHASVVHSRNPAAKMRFAQKAIAYTRLSRTTGLASHLSRQLLALQ